MPSAVRRVDIRDVARHAGVSIGTVSNVLNSVPTVSPEYVSRVQDSIQKLGFVRNDIARQLKAGESKTVSLLVLSSYTSFFSALADAAEEAADMRGYSVVLASSAQSTKREEKYLDLFEEQRTRGILLAPISGVSQRLVDIHERGTPVILLEKASPTGQFCTVSVDSEAGGYLAAKTLVGDGRRRIAIVGGPYHQVSDRVVGARRAIAESHSVDQSYMETGDLTISDGRRIGDLIVQMPQESRPTGIFALNDLLAIGILDSLLRSSDISIPSDMSIVGHDDIEFSATSRIPLTTIRQPVVEMAESAIHLVLRESAEGVDHQHVQQRFEPQLVIRGTTRNHS